MSTGRHEGGHFSQWGVRGVFTRRHQGRHAQVIPIDVAARITALEMELGDTRAEVTLLRASVASAFTAAGLDPPASCQLRIVAPGDMSILQA
jgi:hypothetical protein